MSNKTAKDRIKTISNHLKDEALEKSEWKVSSIQGNKLFFVFTPFSRMIFLKLDDVKHKTVQPIRTTEVIFDKRLQANYGFEKELMPFLTRVVFEKSVV